MRQQIATKSGSSTTGSSNVLATDLYISPFNVGFGVVVSGTVTYTVQHTFDNPQTVASPTWFHTQRLPPKRIIKTVTTHSQWQQSSFW